MNWFSSIKILKTFTFFTKDGKEKVIVASNVESAFVKLGRVVDDVSNWKVSRI